MKYAELELNVKLLTMKRISQFIVIKLFLTSQFFFYIGVKYPVLEKSDFFLVYT